jgi:hypothetical protein
MKQIFIKRDNSGKVTFQTVTVDPTENVFFTNMDTTEAHWPTLSDNQVGAAPSPNSSQCPIPVPIDDTKSPPVPKTPPYSVTYKCQIKGHENEQGVINVVAVLSATNVTNTATQGQQLNYQVVTGGTAPYTITDQVSQFTDANGKAGPVTTGGIGPGLQLTPTNTGVFVTGTPKAGTYNFTFTVNDANGRNLQQVQYSLTVT